MEENESGRSPWPSGRVRRRRDSARRHLGGEPPSADLPGYLRLVVREAEWCLVDLDPRVVPSVAWRELVLLGWPIEEIRLEGGGLEEVYLRATERKAA